MANLQSSTACELWYSYLSLPTHCDDDRFSIYLQGVSYVWFIFTGNKNVISRNSNKLSRDQALPVSIRTKQVQKKVQDLNVWSAIIRPTRKRQTWGLQWNVACMDSSCQPVICVPNKTYCQQRNKESCAQYSLYSAFQVLTSELLDFQAWNLSG